jgi:hypothetical protein
MMQSLSLPTCKMDLSVSLHNYTLIFHSVYTNGTSYSYHQFMQMMQGQKYLILFHVFHIMYSYLSIIWDCICYHYCSCVSNWLSLPASLHLWQQHQSIFPVLAAPACHSSMVVQCLYVTAASCPTILQNHPHLQTQAANPCMCGQKM